MFVGPLGDALSFGDLCSVYKAWCCRSSGLGKRQVSFRHREPRPHNRISVTIYLNIGLMVCDMFPTPQPQNWQFMSPVHQVTLLHEGILSASGLVVKFNVAIVEPPVRFRACACNILSVTYNLFKDNHKLFRAKDAFDEPWLEGDEVRVQIYYVRCVLNHECGSAQVSSLRFRSYTGHWLLSCVTLIALYRPLGQKDSNN